jgi:NOL1/NOP2/fmu family ribosome biogenesis protein
MKGEILNSRKVNDLLQTIANQIGSDKKVMKTAFSDYAFLLLSEGKIYLARKEAFSIEIDELRVNSIGVYLGTIEESGFRYSIEGAQKLFCFATKNIISLNEDQAKFWMKGEDLLGDFSKYELYIILKYEDFILGCGKNSNEKKRLINFTPKERRITVDMPFSA